MLRLTPAEMVEKIKKGVPFEAKTTDHAFTLIMSELTPLVGAVIHSGNQLRKELRDCCLLSEKQRCYEEDDFTEEFISSMPIQLIVHDSRYEYDLNRRSVEAVQDHLFGKKVWKKKLTDAEVHQSLVKYNQFYWVLNSLLKKIETRFGGCVLFDIHSYNYKRIPRPTPTFNVGTANIDMDRYGRFVQHWKKELASIELKDHPATTAINDVFYGKGYLSRHVAFNFKNTLVLPTEIKKIYCDEETGDPFPVVLEQIQSGLKKAFLKTAFFFCRNQTKLKVTKTNQLLSSEITDTLRKVDSELFRAAKRLDLLHYVNPVNFDHARASFFKSGFKSQPVFKYRPLKLDPFELKKKIYRIPVEGIRDIHIHNLYRDFTHAVANSCDLLGDIGHKKFFYRSLEFFGEPSKEDLEDAVFILHCPKLSKLQGEREVDHEEVLSFFRSEIQRYELGCKVEFSKNLVADAMVLPHKKTVQMNKNSRFSEFRMNALFHHEVGIHLLTTLNAAKQPLKIFGAGLPQSTKTQEGLAILSEYLSGFLSLERLKDLALRVLAVKMMIDGLNFTEVFLKLHEDHKLNRDAAFTLAVRVFRGGGFTKDHLYLKGFKSLLEAHSSDKNIENLLIGKTSIEYLPLIDEMIERKMLFSPFHKPLFGRIPIRPDGIFQYILQGITAA